MSFVEANDPSCEACTGAVSLLVKPSEKDLGGFTVRRVLPARQLSAVGPFVFFDEMGPADFAAGTGINVRPHPHIGLATVTYLFEGQMLHRDSLGYVQLIEPGAVNLMTAGRGIVHSERTPVDRERSGQRLHGIQTWMALPEHQQEIDPAFVHYPAASLPVIQDRGVTTTIVIGEAYDVQSPVSVHAHTLYLVQTLDADAVVTIPDSAVERAVYVVAGRVNIGAHQVDAGALAAIRGVGVKMRAQVFSRVVIAGGEPIGARHLWWNFVHTSRERIESAKRDWRDGRFGTVPGDPEYIPLPE